MFVYRRLLTALVFTGLCSGAALAEPSNTESQVKSLLDSQVAAAVFTTLHEINSESQRDVLVASYRFEPEVAETELMAKVKIQYFDAEGNPIRTIVKDTD